MTLSRHVVSLLAQVGLIELIVPLDLTDKLTLVTLDMIKSPYKFDSEDAHDLLHERGTVCYRCGVNPGPKNIVVKENEGLVL